MIRLERDLYSFTLHEFEMIIFLVYLNEHADSSQNWLLLTLAESSSFTFQVI